MDEAVARGDQRPTGLRVLVVDDPKGTAGMMRRLLMAHGCKAEIARNGAEALELAHRLRPDVVLLDLTLPGLNGREAAAELRRSEGLERTALVAVASCDADEPLAALFDGYFVKPVDIHALLRFLARVAAGPAPVGTAPAPERAGAGSS